MLTNFNPGEGHLTEQYSYVKSLLMLAYWVHVVEYSIEWHSKKVNEKEFDIEY